MRRLGRRALHATFLLLGVSVLSFALAELAPGDPADRYRLDPGLSAETLEALARRSGPGGTLPERYLAWLSGAARGDWGWSLVHQRPVSSLLAPRLLNTLLLGSVAILLSWLVAVPWGAWAAGRGRPWRRATFGVSTSLLLAVPELVLALGLLVLALRVPWLPVGGSGAPAGGAPDAWARALEIGRHLLLPVAALVLGLVPVLARHVQAALDEVLAAPFVQAARGRGLPRRRVLYRHALAAAAPPLVSLAGLSVGGLLSASLLVEVVTGWPGLGPLFLSAILERDLPVVLAAVMLSTVMLVLGNLSADLVLLTMDPRQREEDE